MSYDDMYTLHAKMFFLEFIDNKKIDDDDETDDAFMSK
jgi:hypothetical protein